MGVAFQAVAILERPGLALVGVDRQVARHGLGENEAPLSCRRKAGAAQSTQFRIFDSGEDIVSRLPAVEEGAQGTVTALCDIGCKVRGCVFIDWRLALGDGGGHRIGRGPGDLAVSENGHRGLVARPNAGRVNHAHVTSQQLCQGVE